MPNKITYTITTSDGKSHQVDEQNINKYGMQSYADAYKGATIRMRDKDGADYDIPLNRFTQARGQGLRPFRFEHRGTSTNTQAGSHAQQVVDEYDESVRRTQPRMTAAQKAKMSNWASSFGQNVGQATKQATQALKRQNDARKDNALRVRRENVGVDAAPYKLGENPNVVETGSTYNPQSGKVEKTYLTEAGNEYVGRDVADLEQNIIDDQKARELDPVNTTLRDAYAERDRLEESMRQRMKEIDDGNKGVGSILRELAEASKQPGSFNPLQQYQTDEQYRQLEAAARKNRATIQTLEDKRDNKMNDFFHSIATTAANGYTFNDGLAEINDAIALLDARKHINAINRKQTTGEPLTEEEQAAASVLAADALNAEVQGQYAGDYGAWARAGQMVPTSIDLMKDIMLTPGASGVAKGVAGKVAGIGTRFLAKQAGETAAKSAAKAIGRGVLKGTGILLGAHTAGAVVSNTAGINRTAGLYGANVAGQTVKDAQGNYKVQDSMDVLDAFVDAERNQIRETGSEMFGEFLPGAGGLIKKGLEKIGLSKISNALTNIGNKQWYQQYNRLLTAGGYNGIPGEALEEYEGMAFDALTGNAGETWQQLKDPRTHVDIWLGTAAMSALLGAAPVTIQGAHTAMYYRYKHATDKADRTAAYRFGDNEKWNGLKDVIDNTPNEDMATAVMDIMNDSSLYPEQKTAALNYVRNLTKMRGYNIGQMSNANEESEESKAANESYANGYNTENPEELNQIKNRYEVAREKALQAFPQETLDEIENDNSLLVQYVEAPTLRNIVVDYLNTKQAYDGMIQRVRDDIDTQVQQSNELIESRINKTTGMIQPATMKAPDENGNERRAYVISGNVEMLADMSGVDREKSDGSILVRYADTGEMEMVSPSAIMRVDDAISPEQEQQEAETNITQTYAQQKANEIDGKVAFAQGDVYTLTDEAGKVAQVTVVPNKDGIVDNGDGTVNVDAGTGEVVAMPKDAIQIMIDRTNKNKVVPQEEPSADVTYNLNDDVYVQDENGNIVHGVITGDVNEDGQYEVQTDTPVKNVLVNLYTPDQFVQQPQATTTEQPAAEQAPAEQATEQQPSAEQQPTNEQQAEQTQAETAQEEQKPVIPKDEKGNMLYHQVPVETTINDLYDGKLDDNEIRDFVDANISEADKNLEKINKKAPKIGTNKDEYLKKKQEWQKQVEDATRIRDYWNSVRDYIAQQTHTTPEEIKAAQDELSGEAARREYQDMGGSVQQDAVSVASDFIRGAKITPESFKAETGYGTDEQRKFVGMIAKAENGGKTIDRLAEELVSYDNAEMNGVLFGGDTSSAKDAILSVLQGAGTRGELKQTNEAEEQAYIDARNAARDAQYMEQYGMTYEEYLAYEEQIMPTIWREYNNYDETAFNNMYAEEIEQLIKSRENDTTGEKPTDDRGNQVLSEQQVNQQRGSEGGTEPGTEVQAGVQGTDENAAAPEETQQQEVAQDIHSKTVREKLWKLVNFLNSQYGYNFEDEDSFAKWISKKKNNIKWLKDKLPSNLVKEAVSTINDYIKLSTKPSISSKIATAEAETDTNPTEGQKEAGNYKKGHVRIDGYDITIEQPKGSVRRGTDADGKQWEQTMNNTYGYIRGTEGVDGDHIDIFLSDNPTEGNVYVVDQVNPDGSFDEHKVMYGFQSADDARAAYLSNYEEGWQGLGTITEVSKEEFKKWVNSSKRKTKPFAEYKSVNAIGAQNEEQQDRYSSSEYDEEQKNKEYLEAIKKKEEKPAEEKKPEYGANNKVVSKERYEELKKRMIKKLGQLNFGMDPELIEIGVEMTAYHLEAGARKFADYAKAMINDVGDVIRPYLKSLYNAARDYPDVVEAGLNVGMSTGDEVSKFDVTNFDKKTIDALATADNVVKEQNIKKETEKIIKENEKKSEQTAKKSVSSQKIADLFGDINGSTKSDAQRRFSDTVKSDMLSALDRGEKPYRSIVDLRKRASEVGMDVDNEGRSDILLQELVEDGLVGAAREVVNKYGSESKDSYDLICKLYDMQPTIAARSSNRIKMQQYSTPLPMAWNAAHFAMSGKQGGKVLEPTAGNGMLVFAVPANQVHANELDETRVNNLREQGFAEVTQQDATEPFEGGKQYDAIIANPPFGSREAVDYDGKMIPGLDPQITLNALSSMNDDGKAAIIIGGNMEYAKNGSIKSMKPFFTYLYDHYNVKGVVDMDGKLYAKQGTTFPTRMILIDGRRSEEERAQTTVYPPVESNAVAKVSSFEELYNTVNDIINSKEKTNGTEILHSREREPLSVNNRPSGDTEGNRRTEQPRKNDARGRGNKSEGSKEQGERVLSGERGTSAGAGETRNEVAGSEQSGSRRSNEPAVQRVGRERVLTERMGLKEEPKKRSLTEEKLPYRPHNTAFSLNSVGPSAMVEAMDKILTQIEKENGSIDEFVRKELGYDTIEEAHQALAAEQMDSVAMAIYQMKKGQALIIGDQTGVGKGRQMAALIRWAVKHGEKPIFITQKADLFSDIYRDLVDVGSGDLVPFIFNSDGAMVDSNGNVVHKPLSASAMSKVFASGELPDSYDFAVLTYSQVNTGDAISQKEAEEAAKKSGTRAKKSKASKEGKPTPKATFLRSIAKDNYLFLDESHTAAGSSNTGAYLQSILKSAKAATFASATFAKRPDTMPLYAIRTAMSQAKIEPEKLISIIEKGGVTLQEIMSRELTNAGQMVRRERDMSDVKTDWKTIDDPATVKRARENYDKTIQAFNAIIKFQNDFVKPKIDDLDQSLAIVAQSAGVKKGTDKMGVENVPFASKTYNYTKQLMLALKVDAIADEVEKEIKAGRHPVIALESTMESTIKDYNAGEVIKEPTFSASLLKGLDSVMQYTIKDEDGKETHARYAPNDLGKSGEEAYYNLQKLIRESTSDIFISPLDAIIERLHEKGYKVGELTGRNLYVERNENGEVVVKRRTDKDKKKMQRDFNSGNLDVLILNKSAFTGISLHASEKFKDQRQRTLIIAQPLSDINDYMQMIGRIDRTGQVHRGYYINLGLPVPAENRFLMMLSTKLKSLNANTTTSQDSKSNEVEAPDLLNKYGSQVVVEYLRDNPEVYEKMGAPLKKGGLGSGKVQASELDEYKPQDDDARKITGYVALLSTKEQEDFYNDVVKRYNDLIQYLNDTGSNDLKINVMPLRAKTLEKRVSSEGIDPNGTNPFAKNAYVEKVEMDVLRKPMKAEEVRKTIDKLNKTNVDVTTDVIRKESDAKIASENARYENAREKALDDIQKQKEKIEKSKKLSDEEKVAAINSYITDTNNTIEERHDKNLKKITDNRDQLIRRLRMFDAGKLYLVPDNLESMTFDFASPAIFCGYKAKENKITASTTLAVFATLDSRRRIEIKLSDINALQSIDKMTMNNIDAARAITIDNWNSQIPTETRKEGYILTGNILQAIADSQDEYGGYAGHLVSYTDIDGNIHDGILMPDKWNTSLLKSSGAPLSARMEQIKRYEPIVSSDGKVTLNGSQWAEMYYLTVPKTKKDGAMYYENKVLLNASKGEFYPYRGNLRADIPAQNIEGVVRELTNLGVKVRESNDVIERNDLNRQGAGTLTDSELSNANDPAGKMLGKPSRTPAQQKAFAERERQRMADRAREVADILHLDNVEIVIDASTLQGRRAKAKGFYSRDNGKIVIVVPNHVDMADIEQTVLHEAVAHYGLRKLFGSNFDTFLYNVYNNADENVRREIVQLAAKHNWDFATATEEYLASLAESTNFEDMNASWWNKIKDLFLSMVRSIGLKGFSGETLSDNELRYILWRSYENLKNPGRYRNVFSEAEDIAKQNELKVGNYAVREAKENVAENGVDDIESVNRRFNEELEGLTEENKDRVTLTLGRPSPILRAAGVEDRPMKLYGNKVIRKMKKHGFKLDELKDLPEAVANPIAVFKNYGKDGNRSVLTELKTEQGNFLVTLTLGEGHDVDFNIVTSVFGKGESNIIDWINRDFATYINKEKALNYLHHSALKAVTSDNQELSSAANIVRNFDNPSISEDKVEKNDVLYREVEPEERRRVYVADIYDARIKNGMYQMREAVQDSMLSLREAMTEILKAEGNKNVKIEDIAGFENAYLGENRLSSVNKAEADAFANLLFKPLLEEAANLSSSEKGGRDELVNYMMAKHGLERNKVMAERDAKNEYDNYVKEHPKGEKTLDDFIEKYRKRDYAGLTALTGKEKVAEAEAEAQQMVDDYEAEHDTEELWNKTRAVSNAILDKEYDTGLMSKDTMEKLKSMFDYYIPLRGFDEKTSEDEYAYLENKNSAFFAPIKAAKGRKSKADDPFAYLQGMAENAIMQGNRNKLVKQKFLNFVLNHQSDLASVSDLWLKYNEVNDEWEPVFPDNIKDTDTAKEVERKMQEFEERMQQLAEEEPELYKHGKQTVEVPYRVVESRDLKQHQILVRRNGRNYVITINGNPRAAQAVNGLTNPDNDMSGAIGAILKAGQNLNRQLSAFYTTRNPDFVVSNFIRDALYANSMAWVKERPNYALRFHKNYVLANPIKMKKLFARYRKNKLKANSKTDMMFKQFMLNGGETGYASVRDIEKRKNEISKEIKKYQGKFPIKKAWGYLAERFDELNRAVENSARFAAFVTSREMGRSIERSIYDAKEISVNFNKKGSGSKFMGATGQTKLGNAGAFISGLGRSGFVFWNAAIQGSTNFGRQVKRNPAKALTAMATMFMLGAVVASLGYGDDDDDDKNSYWNLPDYVRRSNIMFRAGDQWVSIPLPVEYRSLYGLGELMISTMSDKEHLSGEEIANQIAGQISQVMPIDFLEGEGGVKAFIPSFIKPFAEAYGYNRSWTGLPIYKDTPYNKDMPEWTKAYKSANKYLVDLSETLNEATGGDKYTKGEIDINPAKIEHVLTGYFGGIANTIDRLTKMGETAIGQREYDPNSFLIMNRIIKNGDERTEYKAINNEYFRIKEEHDKLKKRLNNYERDTENGVFDYAEKIDFLYNSPEYRRLEIYEEYQPDIEDLILMMKETNDADEQKDIEAQINELKKMMISDINKYARK